MNEKEDDGRLTCLLYSYVQRMAEQQIPKAICIYQQSLTASAAKVSIG